jgi:hypothetical protein
MRVLIRSRCFIAAALRLFFALSRSFGAVVVHVDGAHAVRRRLCKMFET